MYVAQRCGGTVTPAAGAVASGSGYAFRVDEAALDADARTLTAAFTGRVDFVCAAHGIDWRIGGLKLTASGTTGTLTADVTTASGTRGGVRFAELDLTKADWNPEKDVVTLAALPAKLTADGAALFAAPGGASYYDAGLALDPVTVSLALDGDATLPSTTAGSTGSTGTAGATGSTGSGSTGSDTTGSGTVGGAGTLGGAGTVGGSGTLAATGSSTPTGLLAGAAALVVAAGGAVVVAARRRTTGGTEA
ncbi:hypothetical protein SNE510_32210 [Streptomyces sp. NE5-10]|uniref:HtaA domain-containing protein n=1 Tax=Streptomyces sp. NE5-10 TaxID=2759674 RepID=UPI0019053AA0|nr:HtaA domain-containing protein [Streptomyces sp. NE5-10]GHJ93702.1 hypothetical protein SNE510_32210 [Streptomyces sp. NE5-10]